MRRILIILILSSVMVASSVNANMEGDRALRPDALSYPGSTPEIVSPFDTAELVQIQECICKLKNLVESGFASVESQLDVLNNSCGSTPITQTGDVVISQPGSYCLGNDVSSVTITSSFVTLDMSGYIAGNIDISGASSGGIEHIILENGFIYNSVLNVRKKPIYRAPLATSSLAIDSAGEVTIINVQIESDSAVPNSIDIANAGNVIIKNVSVIGAGYGLNVNSVNTLLVQYCNFTSCQQAGIIANVTSSNSLITIEDCAIKNTGFFGIVGGGVNSQLRVANCEISFAMLGTLGLHWVNTSGSTALCEDITIDGADIAFQLETPQSKLLNCVASNYHSYGLLVTGDTAVFENCTAHAGTTGIVGFFIGGSVRAVFDNCQSFGNTDSGFRITSLNACKFYNCNAMFNYYGFLLLGACTLYSCDASSNTYRGFEANSQTVSLIGLYNCNAMSNAQEGFLITKASGVIEGCAAIQNGGNGFDIENDVTGVFKNCFATGNQLYGYFAKDPNSKSVAYSGNSAVGNVKADYNAEKGKAPYFWKKAKAQGITLFDNAVIAVILA